MISSFHGSVTHATVASGLLLATVIAGAPPASAAPPIDRYQNREFGRSATANSFTETASGYRFAYFAAYQNFDRKGVFESAEAYLYEEVQDGDTFGYREAVCPVDRNALQILKTDATFAGSIDTAACFFNFAFSIDFATGDETSGEGFSGRLDVAGSWQGATGKDSTQFHGRFVNPSEAFNYTCHSVAGLSHEQAAVFVDGSSWASGGFSSVYRSDCNVLSKIK